MNPDGMVSLLNYHEDGVTPPYMILRMAYKWENVNKLGSDFGTITCCHNWPAAAFHPQNTGTDVILSSSFILMLICLKWRHCFWGEKIRHVVCLEQNTYKLKRERETPHTPGKCEVAEAGDESFKKKGMLNKVKCWEVKWEPWHHVNM